MKAGMRDHISAAMAAQKKRRFASEQGIIKPISHILPKPQSNPCVCSEITMGWFFNWRIEVATEHTVMASFTVYLHPSTNRSLYHSDVGPKPIACTSFGIATQEIVPKAWPFLRYLSKGGFLMEDRAVSVLKAVRKLWLVAHRCQSYCKSMCQ